MMAKNALSTAPPYAVERALKRLGAGLRIARRRRNLAIEEVAGKIGTGPDQMAGVTGPAHDNAGLSMFLSR
jgi:hypothetical protein